MTDEVHTCTSSRGSESLHPEGRGSLVILNQADLGSLNCAALEAARRMLEDAIAMSRDTTVEVELNADMVGAAFVGILDQIELRLRSQGRRLKLLNVTRNVREVLAVCGYESLTK